MTEQISPTATVSPSTLSKDDAPVRSRRGSVARRIVLALTIASLAVIGFGGSPADAATGKWGYHVQSTATCHPISSPVVGGNDVVKVKAPTIYAANTTAGLDGQTVGFRQRLLKWNGSTWVAHRASAIWTGFATDSRAALDFSANGQTVRMPQFDFAAASGYFAVVTDYFWYQTNYTTGGTDAAWAYHSNNNPTNYCWFPY